jgi:hypothetical protein
MLEAFHDSCGTSDDQNANKNAGSKDCGNEVSYRNRTLIEDSTWGHSSYIVAKNLFTFWPNTLREADALINQAEKISTQLSIQAVTWVML